MCVRGPAHRNCCLRFPAPTPDSGVHCWKTKTNFQSMDSNIQFLTWYPNLMLRVDRNSRPGALKAVGSTQAQTLLHFLQSRPRPDSRHPILVTPYAHHMPSFCLASPSFCLSLDLILHLQLLLQILSHLYLCISSGHQCGSQIFSAAPMWPLKAGPFPLHTCVHACVCVCVCVWKQQITITHSFEHLLVQP